VNFTVETKPFIKSLELAALKGKYFSSTGLKSGSLSDSVRLVIDENGLKMYNADSATALCINLEAEVENEGLCVIPIKKTVDYLKKMGTDVEVAIGEFFVIESGEKRVQIPLIAEHEFAGAIAMFANNYSQYTTDDEDISMRDKDEFKTITNVYASAFSESLTLCEITNSGVYRLDMKEEILTLSSENGIEKFETILAAVNQKQEDATVEFTAPLHKLFTKDETIKICFNDNTAIFIIGENAKILRAPYVNV